MVNAFVGNKTVLAYPFKKKKQCPIANKISKKNRTGAEYENETKY